MFYRFIPVILPHVPFQLGETRRYIVAFLIFAGCLVNTHWTVLLSYTKAAIHSTLFVFQVIISLHKSHMGKLKRMAVIFFQQPLYLFSGILSKCLTPG